MRLFEVTQLLEYNQQATLNKWGERIAQAATFNEQNMEDNWFYSGGVNVDTEEELARQVLAEFERIDPTKNKQYVMTLVRWYIGNIKKDAELQREYTDWRDQAGFDIYGEYDHPDNPYPEDYKDIQYQADEFDDFEEDFGNYIPDPENLNTFKLEDSDQIKTALERYHSMKPQLHPNERDIGRFKTFYRFEDFVDSKLDPEAKQEIEDKTLNRSDVEVLYNGPLGTVTIPRSHEASCKLGSGTKWCTTGKNSGFYDSYSRKADLIIYNEKPGNEKYQFHVTLNGLEARDSRDRMLSFAKIREFRAHPVIGKILKAEEDKIFATMAQQPWTSDAITDDGGDPVQLVRKFIQFNHTHKGGVMRYVDEYYTVYALPSMIERGRAPGRDFVKLMLTYAQQRGKPWPEMNELFIKMLYNLASNIDANSNVEIKTINRLVGELESLRSSPELEKFKTHMLDKIGVEHKPLFQSSMNEMRRLINLVESAEQQQLDEGPIAKALGTAALAGTLAMGSLDAKADSSGGDLAGQMNQQQVPTYMANPVDPDIHMIQVYKPSDVRYRQIAQDMGIDATGEFSVSAFGWIPVSINGKRVPSELYNSSEISQLQTVIDYSKNYAEKPIKPLNITLPDTDSFGFPALGKVLSKYSHSISGGEPVDPTQTRAKHDPQDHQRPNPLLKHTAEPEQIKAAIHKDLKAYKQTLSNTISASVVSDNENGYKTIDSKANFKWSGNVLGELTPEEQKTYNLLKAAIKYSLGDKLNDQGVELQAQNIIHQLMIATADPRLDIKR